MAPMTNGLDGNVVANKDGNHSAKCRIDRIQIESIAKSSKRHTYLTVEELRRKQI